PGGGPAGQVATAIGDTITGVGTALTPLTDTLQHTVTQLGQVTGSGVAAATGGAGAATRTVGGIVSGAVPAIGSNGGVFAKS
ncbi:MAG TPA: adhesin, partial [Acidimicrobiia bacterium]|nr:adhesin [Acidimicrobiia bacterium]